MGCGASPAGAATTQPVVTSIPTSVASVATKLADCVVVYVSLKGEDARLVECPGSLKRYASFKGEGEVGDG